MQLQWKGAVLCQFCDRQFLEEEEKKKMNKSAVWPTSVCHCSCIFYIL